MKVFQEGAGVHVNMANYLLWTSCWRSSCWRYGYEVNWVQPSAEKGR